MYITRGVFKGWGGGEKRWLPLLESAGQVIPLPPEFEEKQIRGEIVNKMGKILNKGWKWQKKMGNGIPYPPPLTPPPPLPPAENLPCADVRIKVSYSNLYILTLSPSSFRLFRQNFTFTICPGSSDPTRIELFYQIEFMWPKIMLLCERIIFNLKYLNS